MVYTTKNPNTNEVPDCMACQSPMVLRQKGGDKFWGCPNWQECGGKTFPYGKQKPTTGALEENANKVMISDILKDILAGIEELRADIKDLREEILNK